MRHMSVQIRSGAGVGPRIGHSACDIQQYAIFGSTSECLKFSNITGQSHADSDQ